jgi:hypothetical protein
MQTDENEIEAVEGLRHRPAPGASWDAGCANDADPYDVFFESPQCESAGENLHLAVDCKKRDNVALGETLVRIGLLRPNEMLDVRIAQARGADLGDSLRVASAIRSRLGDMLLRAQRITSEQLEFALELQRKRGGLLGETLVSLGWLDRETLDVALETQAKSGRKAA